MSAPTIKGASLYAISEDLLALDAILDDSDGEITEAAASALEQWFAELGDKRDAKVDGYVAVIRTYEARAQNKRDEASRLEKRADIDENKAKRLRERLRDFLVLHDLKKIETSRFTVSVQLSGGVRAMSKLPPVDDLPLEFVKTVTTSSPDTDALRAALDAGRELSFAHLQPRKLSLRIK